MHPKKLQSPQVMLRPLMLRSQLFLLSPFKLFPLVRALRISRSLLLSSPRKKLGPSQRNMPPRLAHVLFLFLCCFPPLFFIVVILFFFFFKNIGIIVMRLTE